MARIRTVKPTMWTHEGLSALPEATHLLAVALLTYADDEGYFNANTKLIQAELSPLREPSVSIHGSLTELSVIGYLQLGRGIDSRAYGRIVSFATHQKINRPTPSKIAALAILWEGDVSPHAPACDNGVSPHGGLTEASRQEGKGKEGNKEGKRDAGHGGEVAEKGGFEEFFSIFPNQVAKPLAEKAFAKALEKAPAALIIAGAERYAIAQQGMDPKFIKHPNTWLNEERWADGLGGTKPAAKVQPHASWGKYAAELAAKIGQSEFDGWLADGELILGPPVIIRVGKQFIADNAPTKFGRALAAVFGCDVDIQFSAMVRAA